MNISPFHALYKTRTLSNYAYGNDKLIPVFASSDIKIYPYQIAAALFALRSPYQKGIILCDDASLGKSYEAMLILSQMWYEGAEKIILIVTTPLLRQWTKIFDEKFTIPFISIDNDIVFDELSQNQSGNPFDQEAVIITTYEYAYEKAEYVEKINWQASIFDEAHRLRKFYTGESKMASAMKNIAGESKKILLTATPMQNDILDLYGLITFIDDEVFPDADVFYKKYFRKPENYNELANRVSKFCFRTMRDQVGNYVKITNRIPLTAEFTLTPKEQKLYGLIEQYLQMPSKKAFPKMESYDLTLMLFRIFSSSTFAFKDTVKGISKRLSSIDNTGSELSLINEMLALCEEITENAKGNELLIAIDKGLAEIKKLGGNKKVIIFTEHKATQNYLFNLLNTGKRKGKVLTFSGNNSRDYTIMERFEKEAEILITTDIASEGFNIEFCSFVINYELTYNTLQVEQRICRCHRQEQDCDVLVLNFINKNNFADVRMLELINKRSLQFDGIMGMSDDIIGNFGSDLKNDIGRIMATARTKEEIDKEFDLILQQHEPENKRIVNTAEQSLYTSFDKKIQETVTITPKYIEDKTKEINGSLWNLTKYFFDGKLGYSLDDETRTLRITLNPQKVFTGARLGRQEYSMTDKTLPKSGWHTVTGTLAKNILNEIVWKGVPDNGEIIIDHTKHNLEKCKIGLYEISIKPENDYFNKWNYYIFIGKTTSGKTLTDDECRSIMDLPVLRFTATGEAIGNRNRHLTTSRPDDLDSGLNTEYYLEKTIAQLKTPDNEEIEKLKAYNSDLKTGLEKTLDKLRADIKQAENTLDNPTKQITRAEKLQIQKSLTMMQREFMQKEENQFLDGLRLDRELEEKIKAVLDKTKLKVTVNREFIIQVKGESQ